VPLLLVLINLHFAENKLTWKQSLGVTIASLIPFVNALLIITIFAVVYKMAAAEIEKGN
jgi:hypothetical protein